MEEGVLFQNEVYGDAACHPHAEAVLRIEDCEQSTLRCNGNSDTLCVGKDTMVIQEGRLLQFKIKLSTRLY